MHREVRLPTEDREPHLRARSEELCRCAASLLSDSFRKKNRFAFVDHARWTELVLDAPLSFIDSRIDFLRSITNLDSHLRKTRCQGVNISRWKCPTGHRTSTVVP